MATFFEQQHLARRNTRVMMALFLLAVVAVVASVDIVLGITWMWATEKLPAPRGLYVGGALITVVIIFAASVVKTTQLGAGGAAVAQMVRARRVAPDTRDLLERRLVNVVEEMAIASGVRVPTVCIMDDERGINAFAAGWDVSGAVVTVTRGTLETLTRDELQGVIGHEFSHILNGDMRLNIRMLGVLAGIVFIGAIGEFVMRNVRGSSNGKSSGGIFFAGLALFLIGYAGLFFSRLIKAAVSRQREFLADASSVQFTRNPDGLAGALDQIRVSSSGALISSRHGESLSHMFFGQGIKVHLSGLFDTHPPIEERIKRVNPRFQPSSYRLGRSAADAPAAAPAGASGFAGAAAQGRRAGDVSQAWGRSAGDSAKLVGVLDAGKVDYAARLLAKLPAALREGIREPQGASAAMIALLLSPKGEVMQQQIDALEAAGLGALAERTRAAFALTHGLGPAFHLPVVDLALPAVKAAAPEVKKDLITGLEAAINADRRVSLHEFVVLALVRDQLAPKARPPAGGKKLSELKTEASVMLALIAHAGTRADATGERRAALQAALRAGAKEMGLDEQTVATTALSFDSARAGLEALKTLAPLQKALLVKGLFAAATADGEIKVAEAELMRLVGAVLDCPLPPLLESLELATFAA